MPDPRGLWAPIVNIFGTFYKTLEPFLCFFLAKKLKGNQKHCHVLYRIFTNPNKDIGIYTKLTTPLCERGEHVVGHVCPASGHKNDVTPDTFVGARARTQLTVSGNSQNPKSQNSQGIRLRHLVP